MPDFKCTRDGKCFGRRDDGGCDVMTKKPKADRPCPFQKPDRFKKADGSEYDFDDHIWDYEELRKAKDDT